ncbi:MAG: hypothetical protein ACI4KN_04570, partial [Gemmiger sp.]
KKSISIPRHEKSRAVENFPVRYRHYKVSNSGFQEKKLSCFLSVTIFGASAKNEDTIFLTIVHFFLPFSAVHSYLFQQATK